MNNREKDGKEVHPIKLFGMLLPSMPSLMIRLSGTFLRFKRDANRAGRVFKKELIKKGINKKIAKDLTENYLAGSNIRRYIQNFS